MLSIVTEPEEALTYDEMRCFLYGVAITPDMIMPSEWLPYVFGKKLVYERNRLYQCVEGFLVNKF